MWEGINFDLICIKGESKIMGTNNTVIVSIIKNSSKAMRSKS